MKITIENDQESPIYIKFENESDLNLDPAACAAIEVKDGAELYVKNDHIETKNIKRP